MGPRQVRQSEVGSPEGRVTVTPVPAAAEGKHLQEKGELGGRNEGRDGRSLAGCPEHLHSATQHLDPVLWYKLGNHTKEKKNPS